MQCKSIGWFLCGFNIDLKCIQQFRNIHNKTPVSEYLFNKFAGLKACNFIKKRLQLGCFFLWILRNVYDHPFWRTRTSGCFWNLVNHIRLNCLNKKGNSGEWIIFLLIFFIKMTRVSRNINHFRPLVLENKYSFVFDITLTPFIKNCIT